MSVVPSDGHEDAQKRRPLYVLLDDADHDFIDRECRRRRQPGRAPLPKAVIVREMIAAYQQLVRLGEQLGAGNVSTEISKQLLDLARACSAPITTKK